MALCDACGNPAVVQWRRRPTDSEFADIVAAVVTDSDIPAPVRCETLIARFACAAHSISLDSASLVHAADCVAPPACACTPEPVVISVPGNSGDTPPAALPEGW